MNVADHQTILRLWRTSQNRQHDLSAEEKSKFEVTCMSRIVAVTVKNIDTKILFAFSVGWLDSLTVQVKKIKAEEFKYVLSCVKTSVHIVAYVSMCALLIACIKATILGTLGRIEKFKFASWPLYIKWHFGRLGT